MRMLRRAGHGGRTPSSIPPPTLGRFVAKRSNPDIFGGVVPIPWAMLSPGAMETPRAAQGVQPQPPASPTSHASNPGLGLLSNHATRLWAPHSDAGSGQPPKHAVPPEPGGDGCPWAGCLQGWPRHPPRAFVAGTFPLPSAGVICVPVTIAVVSTSVLLSSLSPFLSLSQIPLLLLALLRLHHCSHHHPHHNPHLHRCPCPHPCPHLSIAAHFTIPAPFPFITLILVPIPTSAPSLSASITTPAPSLLLSPSVPIPILVPIPIPVPIIISVPIPNTLYPCPHPLSSYLSVPPPSPSPSPSLYPSLSLLLISISIPFPIPCHHLCFPSPSLPLFSPCLSVPVPISVSPSRTKRGWGGYPQPPPVASTRSGTQVAGLSIPRILLLAPALPSGASFKSLQMPPLPTSVGKK